MSELHVTLIDVGWGDSILIESVDEDGESHFALVDSNDEATLRSSYIFLKRFFEKRGMRITSSNRPFFEFVMLSHVHSDHGKGLKAILRAFGAKALYYPKYGQYPSFFSALLHYARRPNANVRHHQSVDSTKELPPFGDAALEILWPHRGGDPARNENNNSIVLAITLANVTFVLTGDAESRVWDRIASQLPANAMFFKVPHHGSQDATFGRQNTTPWLTQLDNQAVLAISSHVLPFSHPHPRVIRELDARGAAYYRTDQHYHVTVTTDGRQGQPPHIRYSH